MASSFLLEFEKERDMKNSALHSRRGAFQEVGC